MKIINDSTVELTEHEQQVKQRFGATLEAGWGVEEAIASIRALYPREDPAFYDWLSGQAPLASRAARLAHKGDSDVFIVIVNNGDTEPELHGFHDGDMAREFAAFRGGDVEDITVLGKHSARELIEAERKL